MAPLASEPRQVLIVLNLAKRKALYILAAEITQYMRSQLKLKASRDQISSSGNNNGGRDAPLFVPALSYNGAGADDDPEHHRPGPGPPPRTVSAGPPPPASDLVRLRSAALAHFDAWQTDILGKLKELLSTADDAKIIDQRRKRTEQLAKRRAEVPSPGENLIDFGASDIDNGKAAAEAERARAVARLQASYHPIPTRLTTISAEDREEALSCVLLLLLSTGKYPAESRTLAIYLASALGLPLSALNAEEVEIAKSMVEASTSEEAKAQQQQQMSADAEAQKRKQENQTSRYWKVGLASVAGAAIIGVTGGLAAPVVAGAIGGIMGSVGLGGLASFLGIFWMNGALVGTLFGAFGARMTGEMVNQYAREIEDFRFIPLRGAWGSRYRKENKDDRRLRVTVGVNGWLTTENDITGPWRFLGDDSEVFALRYEVRSLLGLGQSLKDLVSSKSWNFVKAEILKRTVLATLWSALWPAYLLSAATSVDNPFSLARNRSEKAGEILADAIINKVQGERPITLIGYSLGARAIYACLRSLAARRAFGLVDTVVFIGAPVPSNSQHWQLMRSVVSGKIYNVYSENDYLLAFLYRATSIQLGVAGLQAIHDIEGVENIDLSEEVQGHMRYSDNIAKILDRCGFPVVEGAAGPIEKELDGEDGIALDDLEREKTGTLIDFGDLAIVDPPPSYTAATNAVPAGFPVKPATQPGRSSSSSQPTRPIRTTMTKKTPSALLSASEDNPLALLGGEDDLPIRSESRAPAAAKSPLYSHPSPALTVPATKKEVIRAPMVTSQFSRHLTPCLSSASSATNPVSPEHQQPRQKIPGSVSRANALPMAMDETISKSATTTSSPMRAEPSSPPILTSSHDQRAQHDNDDDEDNEDYGGIKMVDNDDDFEYLDPTPMEDY
ncbi:hypothetical protein B0H66DRAFT_28974 [Apodospora peruviana]|uniref:Transmembrane and coiled-coil domain-containing protein n=1 Tax=Apodospora peruviana TaxID=516989 RepID=A0AAE0IQK7_9PEZI|nr:hypothetical protein B0H66DRAFT_28974 [Apodospora peruviana]